MKLEKVPRIPAVQFIHLSEGIRKEYHYILISIYKDTTTTVLLPVRGMH